VSLYVDELFNELSELPAEEREVAIVERCSGDAAAEAQIRALFSADEAMVRPVALTPGAELGRYRLERRIGEGATASVWQAWDTHLRSYTALKLLHPDRVRGDGALAVVLHEARAASSIISDHVVRIKTAGRLRGGPPFIEMELCAEYEPTDDGSEALVIGSSLSEVGLDSLAEKVRVIAEAARGVEAAHRIGVLHRDLKPGNILLTPVSRRAKVTDFGLAADQVFPPPDAATGPARTVTVHIEGRRGAIVGTPAYMPPEQARGEPPTRATDVYGLGATLYALIVGDHPYLAREGVPVPALDVLAQVRRGPPEPVASRARVPQRLARIIERAMARGPRQRHPTAAALADDLEAWLAGYPASTDGRAVLLSGALFVGRHRTAAATVGLLLLGLVGFGAAVGVLELQRRELTAAIDEARTTVDDYARQVGTFEEQVVEAASVLERTERELADMEEAHRQALESESAAERRYRLELSQRRVAEEQLESVQDELVVREAELDTALGERDTARTTRDALRAEVSWLVDELEAMRTQLAASGERIGELQQRASSLEASLAAAEAERRAAQAALAAAEAELMRLRGDMSPVEAVPPDAPAEPQGTPREEAIGGG